jgi:protein MYSM1
MLLSFGSQTRLQKLLDSLKAHLFIHSQDEHVFLETIKNAIIKDFVDKTEPTAAKEDE